MKSTINYYTIISSTLFIVLLSSCNKSIEGCMDSRANNRCGECNVSNNESCEYTGEAVIWYQYTVGDSLEARGHSSLRFYIDGNLLGTTPVYHHYWPLDPIFGTPPRAFCGDADAFTFQRTWLKNDTQEFNYSVRDTNDVELFSGAINFKVNQCPHSELKF